MLLISLNVFRNSKSKPERDAHIAEDGHEDSRYVLAEDMPGCVWHYAIDLMILQD
jgi:hypothetical protein